MSHSKWSTFIHASCLQYQYPVLSFTYKILHVLNLLQPAHKLFFPSILFQSNHLILIKPAQLFISHLTFSKMRLTAQTLQFWQIEL